MSSQATLETAETSMEATAATQPERAPQTSASTQAPEGGAEASSGRSSESGAAADGSQPAPAVQSVPRPPVAEHVAKLSDRAIQRIVGGNAWLRGRSYARRGSVEHLSAHGRSVSGEIQVRNQPEPYRPRAVLQEDGSFVSECNCPGWRGPTGHCKHVAAVLVALRDKVRPPRPKQPGQQQPKQARAKAQKEQAQQASTTGSSRKKRSRRRKNRNATATAAGNGAVEVRVRRGRSVTLAAPAPRDPRNPLDAWLPPGEATRPRRFEYRIQLKTASMTVTPVDAETRAPVEVNRALSALHVVSFEERPLFRALSRHLMRGKPHTAELRGEDAAEVLSLLRRHHVLLEPASKELRFGEEPLQPVIELEPAREDAVRVRIAFSLPGSGRRFSLSNGSWFEGSPGWHVDPTEGMARPVAERVTAGWLRQLFRSPALVVPLDKLPELLTDFLPRVATALGAELPELEQVADVVDLPARFELRVDGDIVLARARLFAHYEEHRFEVPLGDIPPPLAFLPPAEEGGRPRVVRRDVGAEMAAAQKLFDLGFAPSEEDPSRFELRGEAATRFWTEGVASLPSDWEKLVPSDLADVRVRSTTITPQLRVKSGVDWLHVDVRFDAEGVGVDPEELRACLESGRRLVRLADGSYAPVDPEQVGEVLEAMAEMVATGGAGDKLPVSQAGRVQELLRLVPGAEVDASARKLFEKLQDVGQVELVAKPRGLKATLRPYQKEGFSWLVHLHKLGVGGILADDMGLGKTLQTIALFVWVRSKHRSDRKPNLVVAPTSVVPNWQREIEKFAPTFKVVTWHGADRHQRLEDLQKADVVITSYALMRRDEETLSQVDFRYVVLDEAQHIKNPLSQTARAAKRLRSERRLALTGTPIENRLSEFWSIFDFVSPGLLSDLKGFEERYARPIDRGDEEAARRLRAIVQPFVLRRTKEEVAKDLPPKIEQEMLVPMTEEQQRFYRQLLQEVRKTVLSEVEKVGVSRAQIQILAALTRLRQVACDPRLLGLEPPEGWSQEPSGKLSALREILQNAVSGGHRVLVFSQFVRMLERIREMLEAEGIRYEYLDGSTKDRMERVDRFNEDESIPVFLISLKAGGTGLNLTGADTVVHFDPWWNPAVEDQATDRAHRIGQTKVVTVYRLIARGSVEEKILALSAKKRQLVEQVLASEGAALKGLTRKDIDALFSE